MAKATKKKKEITLKEIAIELNDVMEYGLDPKTGEIDEADCIDVDEDEDVLLEIIKTRASEDLRAADEEAFSPDAWKWFIDNGITPTNGEDDEEDDAEEELEEEEDEEDEEEEETSKKPVKKSSKAAPAQKPAKEKAGTDKAKGKAPGLLAGAVKGNEKIAMDIVLDGGDLDDCIKEFTKVYKQAGKADGKYEVQRAKIYYNIAVKRLTAEGKIKGTFVGKTVLKKKAEAEDEDDAPAKKAPAKTTKPAQKPSQKLAKKK